MNKANRALLCVFIAGMVLAGTVVYGEEASLVPEKNLRFTLAPSYGFQIQQWDKDAEKVTFFNIGAGIEYGPADWINLQILWIPGINVWSKIDAEGNYGRLYDLFAGTKVYIAGEGALIDSEKTRKMRFSAAVGLKVPLMSMTAEEKAETLREPDQQLWGSALRLYFDYIFHPYFYANVFAEGVFYPPQWTANPGYSGGLVKHWTDITGELEGHFEYPIENAGIVIKAGIPVRFFFAPVINAADIETESSYCFSAGAYIGIGFTRTSVPLEFKIRYQAPISGKNYDPVHRVSLIARISAKVP